MRRLLLVLNLVSAFACKGNSGNSLSGYQDTPEEWSCKELDAELKNKKAETVKTEATVAAECAPAAAVQEPAVPRSNAQASATTETEGLALAGRTYNTEAERKAACDGNKQHIQDLATYLERLQKIYDEKKCQNAKADSQQIYDRAECLKSCSEEDPACYTCRYAGGSVGAGFASCSTQADADQAALRVCNDLGGRGCSIDACYQAKDLTGNKPLAKGDKGSAAESEAITVTTTGTIGFEGDALGATVTATVSATMTIEGTFQVLVQGGRNSLGTGEREGQEVGDDSATATWTCSGTGRVSGVVGTTAGFTVYGNGMYLDTAFDFSRQDDLTHGPFRAAGLQMSYMAAECRSWAEKNALPGLLTRAKKFFTVKKSVYADCAPSRGPEGCPCDPQDKAACESGLRFPKDSPVMCMKSKKDYFHCERVIAKGYGNCLTTLFRLRCATGSTCVKTQDAGFFSGDAVGICK